MHRVLLSSPHIGSYSALLLLAFVAGWWLARRNARRVGIAPRHIDNITLLTVVASLFGARFFSWLFYFPPGYGFWKAMTMGGGGLVFYGGLIFGIAVVLIYSISFRIGLRHVLDAFAAPAALGLAFGRVGCFLAGCCWGDVCVDSELLARQEAFTRYQIQTFPFASRSSYPLAVRFPRESGAYQQHRNMHLISDAERSLPVHPVQLYEAVLVLSLARLLQASFARSSRPGQTASFLVLGYAAIRFVTEFFRADNHPIYWGMTVSQVISAALAGCCMLLFVSGRIAPMREVRRYLCGGQLRCPWGRNYSGRVMDLPD